MGREDQPGALLDEGRLWRELCAEFGVAGVLPAHHRGEGRAVRAPPGTQAGALGGESRSTRGRAAGAQL